MKEESLDTSRMFTSSVRYFVTKLLLAGANVVTVAQLIGDDVATLIKHYTGILSRDHVIAVRMLPTVGGSLAAGDEEHFRQQPGLASIS